MSPRYISPSTRMSTPSSSWNSIHSRVARRPPRLPCPPPTAPDRPPDRVERLQRCRPPVEQARRQATIQRQAGRQVPVRRTVDEVEPEDAERQGEEVFGGLLDATEEGAK